MTCSHLAQLVIGTPIPITRLSKYLIDVLIISVKRFQVNVASCYQGLGTVNSIYSHSNAEHILKSVIKSSKDK